MGHSKSFSAEADVDVDLNEWTTEELMAELKERGIADPDASSHIGNGEWIEELYHTLHYQKDKARAIQMCRDLIYAKLGKVVA